MLEILALVFLFRKNKANALERGRKPGLFVAMTFVLWFGMEIIGAVIGALMGGQIGAYLVALVFAAIGGLISYVMAKNCKPGDYVPPAAKMSADISQYAETLAAPAAIRLVRERSFVGAAVRWSFILNGQTAGTLANGGELNVYTYQKQNTLRATDAYGSEAEPLMFNVESGGSAVIIFKASSFIPAQSTGIRPLSAPAVQPQVVQSAAGHCSRCGSLFAGEELYCTKCGTRRYVPANEG